MFANGMELLVSIYRHVKITTSQFIEKSTTGNISKYLENINDIYYRSGMYVETLYMDGGFEKNRRIMTGRSTLNTTAEDEHAPKI